jgi:endonuclease YncB( thermonuclease family)
MNKGSFMRLGRVALGMGILLASWVLQAAQFTGKVVGVTDGDTITVLSSEKEQFKIRLYGIDAPESHQAFGSRAKEFTSSQCFGKTVTVIEKDKDRYGRTVAEVVLPGGTNLNLTILHGGMAWWYKDYARNEKTYQTAESGAKAAKRGLWADANPIPPWDFRKDGGEKAKVTEKPKVQEERALTHWLTQSSSKRHNSGCRYFKNSKGRSCGPNDGVACKVCGG